MSVLPWRALRHEAGPLLRLAAPIIVTQLAFSTMTTVDTLFAGRLGAAPLAGVAVGGNLWFLPFVFLLGLWMALSALVAQQVGAGEAAPRIGARVRASLVLATLTGVLWIALLMLIREPVLDLLRLDAETRSHATDFVATVQWAAVPFCWSFVLRNVAEAHGLTRLPLLAGVAGLLTNILFNSLLVLGLFGAPRLGVTGTALATVIAAFVMVGCYALIYWRVPALRALQLLRPQALALGQTAREVLRLGLPIALILTAEASLFLLGALAMARFGRDAVAAHQIAINVASVAFMVPLSIGLATTVRVGHAAGAGQWREVALRGRTGILLGVAFAVISALVMALLPGPIVRSFTLDPTVMALAIHFLAFAAVFQIFDCVQATAGGALRGIKDTRQPMVITMLAYWLVGLPVAAGLAFLTPVGPAGIWWGFIAGLGVAALGLSARVWRVMPLAAPAPSGVPDPA
ncbi:MAG TPA: MATE family efflux transporter [Nevskiaceae bacterium]|nr:MATE family efflux transporter [Nevskiaceae bacterium]